MTQNSHSNMQAHQGPVAAVAAFDDQIVSGSYDGRLGRWKIEGQTLVAQQFIALHGKGINCVAVSPDKKWIATGGSDGKAFLLRTRSSRPSVIHCDHPGDVECAVFSADSRFLLTGGTDGFARLFDTATGRQIHAIEHGKTVGALCQHPNPDWLITGCNDRKLRIVNIRSGQVVKEVATHQGPVKAVILTAHGIISAAHDGRLLVYDHQLELMGQLHQFTTTPKTLVTAPDGKSFWVGCYDGFASYWKHINAYTYQKEQSMSMYAAHVWYHGLTVTGHGLVVSGSFDGNPGLFSSDQGEIKNEPFKVPCVSALVGSGSDAVLFGGDSGRVFQINQSQIDQQVIPGDSGEIIAEIKGAITSLAGTKDDLIVGSWTGEVTRWVNSKIAWKANWNHFSSSIIERAPSPVLRVAHANGRVLVGLYTGGWACFDEYSGKQLWANPDATGAVKCVDVIGDLYAVTGRYDPLRVGDMVSGATFASLPLNTPVSDVVAFSPFSSPNSPRLAVCAEDNEVWIVDLIVNGSPSLQVIHRSKGHKKPIKAFTWADSETVIAGDYDGNIFAHRVGQPMNPLAKIACRTGISGLAFCDAVGLTWSSFDGLVGTQKLPIF